MFLKRVYLICWGFLFVCVLETGVLFAVIILLMKKLSGYNLAIETSSRCGSVSIGFGGELLASGPILEPGRHSLELMPTIDGLCQRFGVAPSDLCQIYVDIGPGSFTGLRIGLATAKMLNHTLGVDLVGVGGLEVLAWNVAVSEKTLVVSVNSKKQAAYMASFVAKEGRWVYDGEGRLQKLEDILSGIDGEVELLGDHLPDLPGEFVDRVRVLDEGLAVPRSEGLWFAGRGYAERGEFLESDQLLPIYARVPEAVELWNKRNEKVC